MQKVLIISYFFPPCNLTASQRVMGWAKYLHQFGYKPIIVTRNWDITITTPEDVLKSTGKDIIHEVHDQYEVYYMPYKASIRDRFFTRFEGSPLQKLSRIFTFIQLIGENFSSLFIPHRNLYSFAKKLLRSDKELQKLIISGNPFNQFLFGYKLSKKYDLKWIADYRDDWNTSEIDSTIASTQGLIKKMQAKSEKKWVGSASFISSVSPHYVDKISLFVHKPGFVLLNGHDLEFSPKSTLDKETFVITYNGSLYPTQSIEPVLKVFGKLIQRNDLKIDLKLQFPGLAFDLKQKDRILAQSESFKENILITQRISKENVIKMQSDSDLLLMLSHKNTIGIPSSKLYEYIGLKKPILLFPSDKDIIEKTLIDTGLGLICNSEVELEKTILNAIHLKINDTAICPNPREDRIVFYSRKNQTKSLAETLDVL